MTIVRLTPEQKAEMDQLARELRAEAQTLCDHVRDDASVKMLRQDLGALRERVRFCFQTLGDAL